jgi:ribulose-5-phosphate 4-epimerase/fuculose-1-phosphate aldolase
VGCNLCVRFGDEFLVSPSNWSLRDVTPECVVRLDSNGSTLSEHKPSKEAAMHLAILRARPDLNVVCHVHGVYIVAASAMLEPGENSLPPLCPGFVYFAYPLPMLRFMVPGSAALAAGAAETMLSRHRMAVLLQNHGLVAAGPDWQTAVNVAEEVDEAASVFVHSHGKARHIGEENIRTIRGPWLRRRGYE